jgi:putative transcriptional regulator
MGDDWAVESLIGRLLIAGAPILHPVFRKTVVLVTEHGEAGAVGVVLNRPSSFSVEQAAPSFARLVPPGAGLYIGGPVQPDAALVLADFHNPEIAHHIVMGSIGLPAAGIEEDPQEVRQARVFAGYAGWGPGQLENEIDEASWIIAPALPDDVFTEEPDTLWSKVLRRQGARYRMLAMMPWDPSLN